MKKLLGVAFALLLVTSTFALTACTEKPSTSSSKAENSQSVALLSPTPTPTPIPTELTEEELNIYYGDDKRMDYAEFMAEEREFKDRSMDYNDGYLIHYSEEKGKIVKQKYNGINSPLGESIAEFDVPYEKYGTPIKCENIFYMVVNDNTIIRFDRTFENIQEIYTSPIDIRAIWCDSEVIYFTTSEDKFYSLHIKSRTATFMYENEKAAGFCPHSNMKVRMDLYRDKIWDYYIQNGEFPKVVQSGTPFTEDYIVDIETGELELYEIPVV